MFNGGTSSNSTMKKNARFIGVGIPTSLKEYGCLLGVSIGPEYYSGESLTAIVSLMENSFAKEKIVTMFADSLDAYNLMIKDTSQSLTLEEARQAAIVQGNEWLETEDGQKLKSLGRVVRWQDIIEDPEFDQAITIIRDLYLEKDARKKLEGENKVPEIKKKLVFSEAMDRAIGARIATIKASMDQAHFDLQRLKILIRQCLEEEAAGELVIAKKHSCDYEAYPGKRNSVAVWVHTNLIHPQYPNVLKWLTIKISNAPSSASTHGITSSSSSSSSSSSGATHQSTTDADPLLRMGFFAPRQLDFIYLENLLEKFAREINGKLMSCQRLIDYAQLLPENQLSPKLREDLDKAICFLLTLERLSDNPSPTSEEIVPNTLLTHHSDTYPHSNH